MAVSGTGSWAEVTLEVTVAMQEEPLSVTVRRGRQTASRGDGSHQAAVRPPGPVASGAPAESEALYGRDQDLTITTPRRLTRGVTLEGDTASTPSLASGGQERSGRFTLTLRRGFMHQIAVEAVVEFASGEQSVVEAFIPVNLDPRRQPRQREGVMEYVGRPMP